MSKSKWIVTGIMVSMTILGGCVKEGKPVIINGSTTMGPVMKNIVESWSRSTGNSGNVEITSSLKGLTLLLDGKTDIAVSSASISSEQRWESQKKGIAIKEILVGYDIIVPIIHRTNKVENLFLGQLADIYTGLIRDWNDVGGKPGTIIVADRIDGSGTKKVMSERFFESQTVVEGSTKINCDSNIVVFVAQHPAAVGYVSKSFLNSSVKALKINGFNATIENIAMNYYPLVRELYLYVNEKSYSGRLKSFIDFVLSDEGQNIMQKSGFIRVNRIKQ